MTPAPLRVLFAVQGEGRGHLTQALALAAMLRRRGHQVVGALAGTSRWGDVPDFFRRDLGARVETVESPGFVADGDGRIRPLATLAVNLWHARRYAPSLDRITATLDRLEPDVVVNFYEGLMGLHAVLRGTDAPVVAVGHQFMTDHPEYPLLPGQPLQRVAMQGYTALVGSGAASRLALSFYDAPDHGATRVTPPLLRPQLATLADVPCDGSILVYLMEPAMAPQLVAWSDRHPEVRIHTFAAMAPHAHSPSLTFHGLSGTAFLQRMAAARGVVCTAGFETVSEAMWLGTPALMVPTPGHYEQRCNAVDAEAVGAGVRSDVLDLDPLLALLDGPAPDPTSFRAWVAKAEARAVGAIEEAAGRSPVGGDGAGDGQRTADVPTVRPARRSGV
ncbi:hypothetical protein B1759_12695 [Rubrivirga sp. SAORIC476]|uniref:glycosyltransferase family protein n=1 Tax=Rubrivirga sp. SAORIC476 TaxID=1961794 RepID=UPI000BA98FBF|nr:glycosyltransferase family protein [Rubrivirga sp. SAORIC476]PAP79206.1 hypothetical protein B1759_12695 [Rubrivirga sp. SAORIC476]